MVTGDWEADGSTVLTDADLPSFEQALFRQSVLFFWSCLFDGRAYGEWLEWAPQPSRSLRSGSTASAKLRVTELWTRSEHLNRLQCVRLRRLWNALPWNSAGLDAVSATASKGRMVAAIPLLFHHLPVSLRQSLLF